MTAPNVARKIEQTRASIDALKRQAEGVARQIEIQQIKLQAFMELRDDSGRRAPASNKPKKAKKPNKPVPFVSTLPWDRILAAVHEAVGDKEFGPPDIHAQLGLMKKEAPPTTVRSKLQKMVKAKKLIRVTSGKYRFPAVAATKAAA
ncbi:MAG: hypothetical protein WCA56_02065 [Xanthobacteraceae bacterium]